MYYNIELMNLIQIKQVGSLQANLTSLSDSIYETGQTLLGINEGNQIIYGEKTFTGHARFQTGVTVLGESTFTHDVMFDGAQFNDDVNVDGIITIEGDGVPSWKSAPSSAADLGTSGDMAYDADYLYICTDTNEWKRAVISTWP